MLLSGEKDQVKPVRKIFATNLQISTMAVVKISMRQLRNCTQSINEFYYRTHYIGESEFNF